MMTKISEFDASEYLDDEEMIAEYLSAALEEENPDVFLSAVGNVAKAHGMKAIAESTGLGRESLYKAMTPGAKPRYDTVLRVLHSLGVKLNVTAAQAMSSLTTNKKMQLTIAKAARLATPSLAAFAIAADLQRYVNKMKTWHNMKIFNGIDLNDSFIISWHQSSNSLLLNLEASIWPTSENYSTPKEDEWTCYKPATLIFEGFRKVIGLVPMQNAPSSVDKNGEVDYGNIDHLEQFDRGFKIEGAFGSVRISGGKLKFTVET